MNIRFAVFAVTLSLNMGVYYMPGWAATIKSVDTGAEDPEIKKLLDENIPKLRSSDKQGREKALGRLHNELMTIRNSRKITPSMAARKRLSQELIQLYRNTKPKDYTSPLSHQRILQELTLYGDSDVAKTFLLQKFESGSEIERGEILAVLGRGTVTGDEFYNKIEDVARRGLITRESRTTLLARVNKDKALPEILREINSTRDKTIFLYSAWALQDNYRTPEHYRKILPRIKEFGLDQGRSFKGGDGMFWIDAELLAAYVEKAEGIDLRLALELISGNSSLCKPTAVPVLIRKLSDSSPANRVLAAKALRKSTGFSQSDKEQIKSAIRMAADREQDPSSKKVLEETIKKIDRSDEQWQRVLQKQNERNK